MNVRLRRGAQEDDAAVAKAVDDAGLAPDANVVNLQRYGFAAGLSGWDPPSPVYDDYSFINPDGSVLGSDLAGRTEAMRRLP